MTTTSDKVQDALEGAVDATDNAVQKVAARTVEASARAKGVAKDAVGDGRDVFESALACGKDAIRANPITTVAVVAVIAYLWGRFQK